jgi:hypothetical protein
MNAQSENTATVEYLHRLRSSLRRMTLSEREDIVLEIEIHIRERMAEGADATVVLEQLGPADELAAEYRTGALLRQASSSFSPLVLLAATFRLARTGLQGFAVFVLALVGYTAAIGFAIVAIVKPFAPEHVGLWVGKHTFDFGALWPVPEGVHEVLGYNIIPVALLLAAIAFFLTTRATRWLIRRFGWRWRGFAVFSSMKLSLV